MEDTIQEKREKVITELKKYRKLEKIYGIISILSFFTSFLLIFLLGIEKASIALGVMLVFFLIAMYLNNIAKEYDYKFGTLYKKEFLNSVLFEKFDKIEYNLRKGFTESQLCDFSFVKYSGFLSKNYLKATYKGNKFEFGDIFYSKGSKAITHYSGVILSTNRPIIGINGVWIKTKSMNYDIREFSRNIEEIELEDKVFKKYTVWAYKDVKKNNDFNKVFTPEAKEILRILGLTFRCFTISFKKGKMNIFISNDENLLEFDYRCKDIVWEDEQERMRKHVEKIVLLLDIILGYGK